MVKAAAEAAGISSASGSSADQGGISSASGLQIMRQQRGSGRRRDKRPGSRRRPAAAERRAEHE